MNKWVDEIYLFCILAMSWYALWKNPNNEAIGLAVIGLNAGAIAFYKWANSKNG